jgi:hypothetical protein
MIQGVVLSAGQPEKYSAAVMVMGMATEVESIDSREKCTLLYVPLAAPTPRFPSSPERGDQCTALTATQKRSGRDKGSN